MSSFNFVLCMVLIWSVSSVHLAPQHDCRHSATLYVHWKKFDSSTPSSIPQYDSGKIFDVLRNHCIEIILENIKAQTIACTADLLDGGTGTASSLDPESRATIQIDSITDTMSTKWKCDVFNNNGPVIRILFELKVKGAKPLMTTSTTKSPGYESHKNNTVQSINDQFKGNSPENYTRTTTYKSVLRSLLNPLVTDHTENPDNEYSKMPSINVINDNQVETQATLESESDPTILVIGCVASIITVGVVACCTVAWCMRKRNANSIKNDLMEMSFEDESATPRPQSEINGCMYDYAYYNKSNKYDYAYYNKCKNSILTRPLPPCPEQKSFAFQLKKEKRPSDEDSNYYSKIDYYFINKRMLLNNTNM